DENRTDSRRSTRDRTVRRKTGSSDYLPGDELRNRDEAMSLVAEAVYDGGKLRGDSVSAARAVEVHHDDGAVGCVGQHALAHAGCRSVDLPITAVERPVDRTVAERGGKLPHPPVPIAGGGAPQRPGRLARDARDHGVSALQIA